MKYYACIDIGGTSIKYGVLSENAEIITKSEMPTCAEMGPEVWMKNVVQVIGEMKKSHNVCGICVSSTGMINVDTGKVVFALPQVPNYTGFDIKGYLEKACNLPCEVENDVNSVVLAESISGSGKGFSSVLGVAIGTGVGGGFCQNGKILHGATYSACEVGYLQIGNSDFEHLGSTTSLIKRVADAKGEAPSNWNGKTIFEAASNGDSTCIKAIEDMANSIATGLASLTYILNPEVIVLGGGIMNEQSLLDRIKFYYVGKVNFTLAKSTQIVKAKYSNDAGMIGALYHFLQRTEA